VLAAAFAYYTNQFTGNRHGARMQPEKITAEIEQWGANALVMNAGGIYSWYHSEVPFHNINEYLPKDYDLLEAIVAACHKHGIRVFGRFDFSKAVDWTWQHHPEWFARNPDATPRIYGKERPGTWSLLMGTCVNGGYWNEEVDVPVRQEALKKYDLDGIQDPFALLNPRLSISEIIAEPILVRKTIKNRTEIMEKVLDLMDIVGLSKRYANTYPHEMDGGRR